jgi:hypothetical protein
MIELQTADRLIEEYSKTYLVEEEVRNLAQFRTSWPQFNRTMNDARTLAEQSRSIEAQRLSENRSSSTNWMHL